MPARDVFLALLVCLVWGFNFLVSKYAVGVVPPLAFAVMRFAGVALCLAPFLGRPPAPWRTLIPMSAGLCALHFGFIFLGVAIATPSTAAVAVQLYPPFATILSILLLGERVRWRRWTGILLCVAGVTVVTFDPVVLQRPLGVGFVALGALSIAYGSVVVRRLKETPPLKIQAWANLISVVMTLPFALLLHGTAPIAAVAAAPPLFWAALAYTVLLVAVFGHGVYTWLMQRHELSKVATLTLLNPVFGILFGVWLNGDPVSWLFGLGALLTLAGAGILALRSGPRTEPTGSAFAPTRRAP